MAWIESHQSLAHHPKTLRLAARLRCGVPAAIGYVHLLWYWALDYSRDGNIDADMRDQVALACKWRGKPETFWLGLMHAGFIEGTEGGVKIHDWMDYAGRLIEKRAANVARTQRARHAHVMHNERETNAHVTGLPTVPTNHNQPEPTNPIPPTPLSDPPKGGWCCPMAEITNSQTHLATCRNAEVTA